MGGNPHKITRPVIGLLWNFKHNQTYAMIEEKALEQYNVIVQKFDYEPGDIDPVRLENEVRAELDVVKKLSSDALSLPDAILKKPSPTSEIYHMRTKAGEIFKNIDALLIPGGADIEPEFYGAEKQIETHTNNDFRRSVLEFALLQQANEKKTPVMGICRGSQMGNVFFGGTLKQHIEGHRGVIQELEIVDPKTLSELGIKEIAGVSLHHQASDKIGKGLNVLLKYEDVPKALISEDGTFTFTQFHPEIFIYFSKEEETPLTNSRRFFDHFLGRARAVFTERAA